MISKITRDILESYLHCRYKCRLKLRDQRGITSDYESLLGDTRAEVAFAAVDKILASHPEGDVVQQVALTASVLKRGTPVILDATLDDDVYWLRFDGLAKEDGPSKLGSFHYVPILFHEAQKLRTEPRTLLEFHALLLARLQRRIPGSGIIWHGTPTKKTTVRLKPDLRKAEQLLRKIQDLIVTESPETLILNTHCPVCEFREACQAQALQEDNISLLRGMGEKEVRRYARKGIFTVTQLSCTFRARKKRKRARQEQHTRYFALQALALRERKIYVWGTPACPTAPVRIYLDIEGDPDNGYIYLVGLLITGAGSVDRHALWGDDRTHEPFLVRHFLSLVGRYRDFTVYHYGSYESAFLRRVCEQAKGTPLAGILRSHCCNVLSLIYPSIYFPTYSNGLKDIGRYLGCTWSDKKASGLQSIVWRRQWERTHDLALKDTLVNYNAEDCLALRRVTECVSAILSPEDSPGSIPAADNAQIPVLSAQDAGQATTRREYCRPSFAVPDLEYINRCAYFDYQRERVYLRTNPILRRLHKLKQKRHARACRISKDIEIGARRCPFCRSAHVKIAGKPTHTKLAYNLKVTASGIHRQVIACRAAAHRCLDCRRQFLPPRYKRLDKHCHALQSWAMYQHIVHRVSFHRLQDMLGECFGLRVTWTELHMIKTLMAMYYRSTYGRIVEGMKKGGVIHADETHVNFQKGKGYVWVLASLQQAAYIYRPTREGEFLVSLLRGFTGVLVSDFYAAYDSVECAQQKCLVHLIRDMNHDLLANPYDDELRALTSEFAQVLRAIVATIDRYGLKRRHLRKHKAGVTRWFRRLTRQRYRSEVAESYQSRLEKNQNTLFTFLDYDGVPWNNNNAEHAVKEFAYYRRVSEGQMTEPGLRDYLVLLTVYETCRFRGVSFLKFMLSGERDIDKWCEQKVRAKAPTCVQLYPKGFRSNHPGRRSAPALV